jgi:hypothetical protein
VHAHTKFVVRKLSVENVQTTKIQFSRQIDLLPLTRFSTKFILSAGARVCCIAAEEKWACEEEWRPPMPIERGGRREGENKTARLKEREGGGR